MFNYDIISEERKDLIMSISVIAILNVLIVTCISLRFFSYQLLKITPSNTLTNNYWFIFLTVLLNYFIVICPVAFSFKYELWLFRPYRLFLVLPIYFIFTSVLNISMLRNRINILGENNFKAATFFMDKISDFLTLIAGITPFIAQTFFGQNVLFSLKTELLLPTIPLAFALNYIKNDVDSQLSFFNKKELIYILIPSSVLWLLMFLFLETGKVIFSFVKFHMLCINIIATILLLFIIPICRYLYKSNNKFKCITGFVLNELLLLSLAFFLLYSTGINPSNPFKFDWKKISPDSLIISTLILLIISLYTNVKFLKKIILKWFKKYNNLSTLSSVFNFLIKILVFSVPYVTQANAQQFMPKLSPFNLIALSSYYIAVFLYFIYLPLHYIDSVYLSDK